MFSSRYGRLQHSHFKMNLSFEGSALHLQYLDIYIVNELSPGGSGLSKDYRSPRPPLETTGRG